MDAQEMHDPGEKLRIRKAKGGITLVPEPSDDPQDPLVSVTVKQLHCAALANPS